MRQGAAGADGGNMERGGKWFMAAAAMLAAGVAAGSARAGERTDQSSVRVQGWQAGRSEAGRDDSFARSLVHGRLLALRAERARRRAEAFDRGAGNPAAASAWAGAGKGLDPRWGGFVLADPLDAAAGHRDMEAGGYALAGGIDYRFSPELAGGLALSWSGAMRQSHLGGEFAANNWGLSAYASYNLGDLYVDGHLGFARLDLRAPRRDDIPLPFGLSASARDGAAGNQWAATVGVGYDLRASDLVVTPYSRLNYVRLRLDTFSGREPAGGADADVGPRSTESLQSALGVRLSSSLRAGHRRVTPYVAFEWNREFGGSRAALTAPYTPAPFTTFVAIESERPTRDFLTVSLGLASVHAAGLSAFAKLDTVFGRDRIPEHAFILGVRGEF